MERSDIDAIPREGDIAFRQRAIEPAPAENEIVIPKAFSSRY